MVEEGTAVYATADGVVHSAEANDRDGNHILLQHKKGYRTLYAHLSDMLVEPGAVVKKGDKIGIAGNTGLSKSPHLHYEIRKNDEPVDPADYLPLSDSALKKIVR